MPSSRMRHLKQLVGAASPSAARKALRSSQLFLSFCCSPSTSRHLAVSSISQLDEKIKLEKRLASVFPKLKNTALIRKKDNLRVGVRLYEITEPSNVVSNSTSTSAEGSEERNHADQETSASVDLQPNTSWLSPSVTSILNNVWNNNQRYYIPNIIASKARTVLSSPRTISELHNSFNHGSDSSDLKGFNEAEYGQWKAGFIEELKSSTNERIGEAAALGTICHSLIDELIKQEFEFSPVSNSKVFHQEKLEFDPNELAQQFVLFSEDEDSKGEMEESSMSRKAALGIAMQSFLLWYRSARYLLDPTGDKTVYSSLHGYAGSLDCLALDASTLSRSDLLEGDLSKLPFIVIDFKTSVVFDKKASLQVAAYAKAVEEMFGISVNRVEIVRLNKKKAPGFKVKAHGREEIDELFQAFLASKTLFEIHDRI